MCLDISIFGTYIYIINDMDDCGNMVPSGFGISEYRLFSDVTQLDTMRKKLLTPKLFFFLFWKTDT